MLTSLGSARKRLLLLSIPAVAATTALLLLVAAAMQTLSAGRAYVGGEGLWSKAQKDAVHHLLVYARSLDGQCYQSYLAAIAVPLGDRKAREALDRPDPDYEAARLGFLEGRNHPDDVDAMATLFVRFRNVSYIDKAIAIWAEADTHIERLRESAGELHAEIRGGRDPARIEALLVRIGVINQQLQPLEDSFSYTLGEATRWMRDILFLVLLTAAVLLVAAATLRTRALLRRASVAEAAWHESNKRLEFLAHHDPLTGLPNRAMLQERVVQAISFARRHGKGIGLLFVDLDQFKHVNDSHGHTVGDALLKAVAARLRESVRQEDIVARLGGDEFCVLLQEIDDPREAGVVAHKLLACTCRPFHVNGQELQVGASIGIACLPQDGLDMEALIRNADVAMYRAKDSGRNKARFFSEDAQGSGRAA